MPIRLVDLRLLPGSVVQQCSGCGADNVIRFDRGGFVTKRGPFLVPEVVEVAVDGNKPVQVKLGGGEVTSEQLSKNLAAVAGLVVSPLPAGALLVESETTGPGSSVELVGDAARGALMPHALPPFTGRLQLGVPGATRSDADAIVLRACPCGVQEVVMRTWDVAPPDLAGTAFYEHRRAVNFLAEHFKAQGWLHPDLGKEFASEKALPPDRHPPDTKLITVPL